MHATSKFGTVNNFPTPTTRSVLAAYKGGGSTSNAAEKLMTIASSIIAPMVTVTANNAKTTSTSMKNYSVSQMRKSVEFLIPS